jgi:hypothetical protein
VTGYDKELETHTAKRNTTIKDYKGDAGKEDPDTGTLKSLPYSVKTTRCGRMTVNDDAEQMREEAFVDYLRYYLSIH